MFVCFQQLAKDISKNSKVRKWEMSEILSSFIMCYFFKYIMYSSQSNTCVAKIIQSSKCSWKKIVHCKKKWSESMKDVR